MDKLMWKKETPKQAGLYWMKYKTGLDKRPTMTMIIQYPDEIRLMFIGDSKLYQVAGKEADNVLWAGPITAPEE